MFERADNTCNLLHHLDNANIARAGQDILEELVLAYLVRLRKRINFKNLCLAGGVFLNSSLNFKIVQKSGFDNVYIVPCASDDGIALGKLYNYIWKNKLPVNTKLSSPYLGPVYNSDEIEAAIKKFQNRITVIETNKSRSLLAVAHALKDGKIVALYQGRSEFGPRALGNRSILADPRKVKTRMYINKMVKHREWYRPLAPVVTEEDFDKYFFTSNLANSPYMTFAVPVLHSKRRILGAVSHVDGTSRVQTVTYKQNPNLYMLLRLFKKIAGVPILLNTSFNDNGQPIVETPEDAIRTFLSMEIDYLFLENHLISKF